MADREYVVAGPERINFLDTADQDLIRVRVRGDTQDRYVLQGNGEVYAGNGSVPPVLQSGTNVSGGAAWVTATAYTPGVFVTNQGTMYIAATAHTSGTFATDLAAGKWIATGPIPAAPDPLGVRDQATNVTPAVWVTANGAQFGRVTVPVARSYRYFCVKIGVQSGNVQFGVVRLSGTDSRDWTRVMDSGVIACPAAGDIRYDLGATVLPPGDYALFMWADNTTVTVPRSNSVQFNDGRQWASATGLAGGVTSTGTHAGFGISANALRFNLEAAVPFS